MKLIIDTDVATDIDDAMAIALALKLKDYELSAITTVYGDAKLRAKLAKQLVSLATVDAINIYPGVDPTLTEDREIFWAGNEAIGAQEELKTIEVSSENGIDKMIEIVNANPKEVTIVAIGPLTNIAHAINKDTNFIKNLNELVIMGGDFNQGPIKNRLPEAEHNIMCDPEAAEIVFNSGINTKVIPLDCTLQLDIGFYERDLLRASKQPINKKLADLLDDWIVFVRDYFGEETTYMHDPLALACAFDDHFVKYQKMDIKVDYQAKERSGKTIGTPNEASSINVAIDVEREAFLSYLFEQLLDKEQVYDLNLKD